MRTRLFRLLLLPLLGSVSISAAPADETAPPPARLSSSGSSPRLLVICVGGMDSDPTPEQIAGTAPRGVGNSGLYQLRCDLLQDEQHRQHCTVEYFNWNGTRAGKLQSPQPPRAPVIATCVREHLQQHPQDRVVLIGNSWGGYTAHEAARLLGDPVAPVAIELLIFLDPSSTARALAKPQALPVNVNRAVNYHTRNLFVWGKLQDDPRLQNIDLGNPQAGYMQNGRPAYDQPLDFQAHVAAEWDPRLHTSIRQHLRDLVAPR